MMKYLPKIKRLLLQSTILMLLISCSDMGDKNFAEIRGNASFKGMDNSLIKIELCKVEHGKTNVVVTSTLNNNGDFGFIYPVEEAGLFVLNLSIWDKNRNTYSNPRIERGLKRFFLEKGTSVEIKIKDGKYELLNTNNDKNILLSKWNNEIDTVYHYTVPFAIATYKDFFPLLPGFVEKAEKFKTEINSGDREFDDLIKLLVDTEINMCALSLLYTPRIAHPEKDIYPDFYEHILEHGAPTSEDLLKLPIGLRYLGFYSTFKTMTYGGDSKESKLKLSLDAIPNDLLKGYFSLESLNRFRTYDDRYLEFKKTVEPYIKNDYLKKEFDKFELSIRNFEKGSTAYDIVGKDIDGTVRKLSDYRGKLVYVDVWATWCGPCIKEIPHLKKLEKKFHNKPIVFLSISIDKPKDIDKWKNFVAKENLGGVQLMADNAFNSKFAEAYKINAIPRFMLFDKDGKVISIDASRPSDKDTEQLFNSLL